MTRQTSTSPSVTTELARAIGELCGDLITAVQGMMVTARYMFRPAETTTLEYPHKKIEIGPNYRGRLMNDVERCIVCELCAKVCPTNCITMDWEIGKDKSRILHNFDIDMTICLYCSLCTDVCPDSTNDEEGVKCLTMDGGYDYSSDRKEDIGFYYSADENQLIDWRARAEDNARRKEELKKKKQAEAATRKAAADKKEKPAVETEVTVEAEDPVEEKKTVQKAAPSAESAPSKENPQ